MAANFQSLPFTVSVKLSEEGKFGGAAAFNFYLLIPFNRRVRIEIENQNNEAYSQYFYIDYERFPEPLSKNTLYFHSTGFENPTNGWAPDSIQTNSLETLVPNLDGKGNCFGHNIGCNQSVAQFQGTWWGEGDDMIFNSLTTIPGLRRCTALAAKTISTKDRACRRMLTLSVALLSTRRMFPTTRSAIDGTLRIPPVSARRSVSQWSLGTRTICGMTGPQLRIGTRPYQDPDYQFRQWKSESPASPAPQQVIIRNRPTRNLCTRREWL